MPLVSLPMPDEEEDAPAATANPALDTEALFAAVGLGPILAARPTLHKYQIQQAANLPRDLRRRILAFVASDAFKDGHDVPAFDYAETLKTVSLGELDAAQARALLAKVPHWADDFAVQANRLLAWAMPMLPRNSRPAVIGTRPMDPDPHATADFRRVWQVALDPLSVLDDLEDGSLSDDQVAALMVTYPAIYGELRQAITDEMAAMEARKGKDWEPPPQKAALLAMIMRTQSIDTELAAQVQQMYAAQPGAKAPVSAAARRSRGGGASDAADGATPGQKAAGGVSSTG